MIRDLLAIALQDWENWHLWLISVGIVLIPVCVLVVCLRFFRKKEYTYFKSMRGQAEQTSLDDEEMFPLPPEPKPRVRLRDRKGRFKRSQKKR